MKRWLVTDFGPSRQVQHADAFWVEAETEPEAAQLGFDWLEGNRRDRGDEEPVSGVHVVAADGQAAYMAVARVERAPLQCCGGLPPEYPERHTASCPSDAPDEERGWP